MTFLQGMSNPGRTGTCETNECIDPREKVLDREKLCDLTKSTKATGTKQHKAHDPEIQQYHNRKENYYFLLLMHSSNTQPQAEVVIYLITNSLCE